ncbi:MAG: c-type cytochrome [Anaerolineales bacterium]|jgi:mono/diheme cytochrome c family protein
MVKPWFKWILIATLLLFLAACSGSSATAIPADNGAGPAVQQDTAAPEIDAAGIFASRCAGCHGADRSGRNGPALLPERLTKDPSAYVAIITNGSGPMPAWGSRLSAEEINALVDYILSAP